jgi:hypothetical protein
MDGTASALLFPASMFRPGLPLPIHENAGVPRPRNARREIGNYSPSSGGNLSAAVGADVRRFREVCEHKRAAVWADERRRA